MSVTLADSYVMEAGWGGSATRSVARGPQVAGGPILRSSRTGDSVRKWRGNSARRERWRSNVKSRSNGRRAKIETPEAERLRAPRVHGARRGSSGTLTRKRMSRKVQLGFARPKRSADAGIRLQCSASARGPRSVWSRRCTARGRKGGARSHRGGLLVLRQPSMELACAALCSGLSACACRLAPFTAA